MPLDAEPAPDGNVYIIVGGLRDGMARVLTASELDRARTNCVPLWMSHHATCPGARQHAVPRSQMRMEFG